MKSSAASRATAALLCVVAFGALVLAFAGMPTSTAVAGPVNLDLDFGVLVPGIPQTRTSSLEVPVTSRVRRAHAASTTVETKATGFAKPDTLIPVAGIGIVGVMVIALTMRLGSGHRRGVTT